MSNKIEFKGGLARFILYLISINGILIIVLLLSSVKLQLNSALILFGVVNVSYLVTVINKPFKIIIDQDKLILEVHYLLNQLRRRIIVSVHEIECSFDYKVLARGGKAKVLKITHGSKVIVELLPDYNGWGEESLIQINEKLNDLKKLN